MKRLKAKMVKRQDEIAYSLLRLADQIKDLVSQAQKGISVPEERVETLRTQYNESVVDAITFMESVHDAQEEYYYERSTRWQEGDSGQSYEQWMDAWNADLEELEEVDLDEDADEPEFEALTVFWDLPEEPEY